MRLSALFALLGVSIATAAAETTVSLTRVVAGLAGPIHVTHAGDGSGRLFVCERPGRLRVVRGGDLLDAPLLDISSRVFTVGEGGLLSVAFHPHFADNGRFYAFYQGRPAGVLANVVEEFTLASGADTAPAIGRMLLVVDNQNRRHLGGQLAFGPDGHLYIAIGDDGVTLPGGNTGGLAQDLTSLRGKILRIDVDGDPYSIPPNNPFVGQPGVREEIWAYGFRNPWRMSFDRSSGRLLVGDVGETSWEEVSSIRRGGNYGWNRVEGPACFPQGTQCNVENIESPVYAYPHTGAFGRSITGGFVYRGSQPSGPFGQYVFADFISGRIWLLKETGPVWRERELSRTGFSIASLGEDEDGELYIADLAEGSVYRLDFETRRVLGQVVDGGPAPSAVSRIEVSNPTSQPAEVEVSFLDQDGAALPIGPGNAATVQMAVPAGGVQSVETVQGVELQVGWARIVSPSPIEASLALTLSQSGSPVADAGFLPAESAKLHQVAILRNTGGGRSTAVSVVNPSETESSAVRLTLRQAAGGVVGEAVFDLGVGRHIARFIEQWFDVGDVFSGVLTIESDHETAVTSIRSRDGIALFGLPVAQPVSPDP